MTITSFVCKYLPLLNPFHGRCTKKWTVILLANIAVSNSRNCWSQDIGSQIELLRSGSTADRSLAADYIDTALLKTDCSAPSRPAMVDCRSELSPFFQPLVAIARSDQHSDRESSIALRALCVIGELPALESQMIVRLVCDSRYTAQRRCDAMQTLLYVLPDESSVAEKCFVALPVLARSTMQNGPNDRSANFVADGRLIAPLIVGVLNNSGHAESELAFLLEPSNFVKLLKDVQQLVIECVKLVGVEAEPFLDALVLIAERIGDDNLRKEIAIAIVYVCPDEASVGALLPKVLLHPSERAEVREVLESVARSREQHTLELRQLDDLSDDREQYYRDVLLYKSETLRRQTIRDLALIAGAAETFASELTILQESSSLRTKMLLSRTLVRTQLKWSR